MESQESDFGLSKIGPANQQFTFLVSDAVGTFGYCDPLYMETGILTKESDVYSFGVVLFEVLCGRLCIENYNDDRRFLARLAKQSYEQNNLDDIVDDNVKEQMDPDSLAIFSAIAYRCLRNDRDERPTMAEVVKVLKTALDIQKEKDANVVNSEGSVAGLLDSRAVLAAFKQYRLTVIAGVSAGNLAVSSIEFDKDDEFFATAGVSRCIKVYDFSKIVKSLEEHYPVAEISTSSKLSCLSWSKDTKNHLASTDYEGLVTVWDVNSLQAVMKYHEHVKRAWSVDFSCKEPSMLVSGGDDCKVKVWCTKQETSSFTIDMVAPICCVKYHPDSSNHIAVSSVDHRSYYYDLRTIRHPLYTFQGHKKSVSYVKFLSNNELATASVDSTLKVWDLTQSLHVRTFKGHKNVKNFVGFSVFNDFIACGSETNEVFTYHKSISKPIAWKQLDTTVYDEDVKSSFISAVCWRSDSPVMVAANYKGTIGVLVLES